MSIAANIAARQAAETVIDLINGELRSLIDAHSQDALAPFFTTLRECYGVNLTVEVVKEVERAPRGPRPMTDDEARAFEKRPMPWGKHKGKLISEVPVDYLQWVLDQPDTFKVDIERYVRSDWVRDAKKIEEEEEEEQREAEAEEMPF